MYPDLIKGYRVTIGGYNAPSKEHRENTGAAINMISSCTLGHC